MLLGVVVAVDVVVVAVFFDMLLGGGVVGGAFHMLLGVEILELYNRNSFGYLVLSKIKRYF